MLKNVFAIDDTSKETLRGFEDCVDSLDKGLTVREVFMDFENRFGTLRSRDQVILELGKMVMFLKVISIRDRKDIGLLMEYVTMESDLTNISGAVQDIVT